MRASDFDGSRLGCDSRHSGDLGTPLLLLSCLVLCVTGCSGKLTTDYGESRGRAARRSVNGLGAFRDALAMDVEREEDTREVDFRSSVRTRDLSRLSYRTDRYESIIWTPTAWPPANADSVYTFMENWLKKDARTLVLVLPDAASTESFWEASLKVAPPESRLHHRRRLARSINERLLSDVRLTPITVSDWFRAVPLPYRAKLEDGRSVQYRLAAIPPKPAEQTIIADHSDDTGASDAASEVTADESGDAASSELEATESAKQESAPKPSVYAPKDQTFTPIAWRTDAVTENHVTQAGADALDRVLAARITRTAWGDSRLIVLAGGGLVTNFAMTTMGGRELVGIVHEEIRRVNAKQPEAEKSFFTEADRIDVAFLKSDTMPLPISDAKPQATAASGMEILTTWPMSAITMHGVFVGFLIVLMLSPIFGRPQRLRYNRASDFGNHLDALAKLMRTLGGPTHARERISQYYRRVRGEVGGPWVLPLPEHAPGTTAPSQPVADQTDAALNQKPRSTDSSVE
ncbi:MAG: hypothetical protein AAGD07_02710 [Planctomycetota bacterium]